MGILEKTLRTKVSLGEQVDVTLIGGRQDHGVCGGRHFAG